MQVMKQNLIGKNMVHSTRNNMQKMMANEDIVMQSNEQDVLAATFGDVSPIGQQMTTRM